MPYYLKELNEAIRRDPEAFVRECDDAFSRKVETVAQKIAEHRGESRVILLSGPSGSGKTTTALKIEEQLDKMGLETHTISMDNYFNTVDPETSTVGTKSHAVNATTSIRTSAIIVKILDCFIEYLQ